MNFANNTIETRRSTDGGATWSEPFSVDARRAPAGVNGVQIAVRPNGHVVLVFSVWGSPLQSENEIGTVRSVDGGVSFAAPTHAVTLGGTELPWLRAPPFTSVDVDAAGTIYVTWRECGFSAECQGDIVLMRSPDGVTWSTPVSVPIGPDDGSLFYFLPALAVDPATSGAHARLALLYHSMGPSRTCDPGYGCFQVDVKLTTSVNGGAAWTQPRLLNAFPILPAWMADTSLGRMLGDYVSVSWTGGRPIPVWSLASAPTGAAFRQSIVATTRLG